MRTLLSAIGGAVALLGAASYAHGQKETERYIPIGQSPGLSQKHTSIGEIAEIDPGPRTIIVTEPAGRHTVKIAEKTRREVADHQNSSDSMTSQSTCPTAMWHSCTRWVSLLGTLRQWSTRPLSFPPSSFVKMTE